MIAKEYAKLKIQEWLDTLGTQYGGRVIVDSMTIERPYGWMFFQVTREYLQTKDPRKIPPGNSAVLCLKDSGKFMFVGTAAPSADFLDEYEQDPDAFLRRSSIAGTIVDMQNS